MAWCGYFGAGKVFPILLLTLFGVDGESPQLPRPAPGHDIGDTADAVRTLITGSAISFFICWQLSDIAVAFVPCPGLAQRLA